MKIKCVSPLGVWARRIGVAAAVMTGCYDGYDPKSGDGDGDAGTEGDEGSHDPDDETCVPGVPQTSQLPLLTNQQYDNTIRDLLGIEGQPSTMLAPDTGGSVDERAWDGYRTAARVLAAQVMADDSARDRVIPCTPSGDGSACAHAFITAFGRRAFRRPLTAEEMARFERLYDERAKLTELGTFDEAAQLILEAFLLSPSFLVRAEIAGEPQGDLIALSDHEVATRLSYMLWGSMPDDELLDVAAAGELSSRPEILAQAQRMLADPRARSTIRAFHRRWAHMDAGSLWSEIQRDESAFPLFDPRQVPAMDQETERFFEHVVFEGGGFADLLLRPVAFVNDDLAALYGLDPTQFGPELERVDLDPATRAGVFTRIGFLMAHGMYDRTSPILRGAFLQKEILCASIGSPPPDAESTPLPTEGATNRERVDAQTAASQCSGCHHALINPTGFALEAYDALGALQDEENGVPIDTSATVLMGTQTVEVSGPVELFEAIAGAPEAQRCYVRNWVEFAYERALTNQDACTVDEVATKVGDDGYTILELIADLTQSESFRHRAVPEVSP